MATKKKAPAKKPASNPTKVAPKDAPTKVEKVEIAMSGRIDVTSIHQLEVQAYCAEALMAFGQLVRLKDVACVAMAEGDLGQAEDLMPELIRLRDKVTYESSRCTNVAEQFLSDAEAFDHVNRYARIAFDRDGRAHGMVHDIQRKIQGETARVVQFPAR